MIPKVNSFKNSQGKKADAKWISPGSAEIQKMPRINCRKMHYLYTNLSNALSTRIIAALCKKIAISGLSLQGIVTTWFGGLNLQVN